jgi:hypothetical protein
MIDRGLLAREHDGPASYFPAAARGRQPVGTQAARRTFFNDSPGSAIVALPTSGRRSCRRPNIAIEQSVETRPRTGGER